MGHYIPGSRRLDGTCPCPTGRGQSRTSIWGFSISTCGNTLTIQHTQRRTDRWQPHRRCWTREERQRLTDLAEQFDLLLGDVQLEEDFQFWRGYLQDKLSLYRTHQTHLDSLTLTRARDIADALKFLSTLHGNPASRALMLADRISTQPFLVNFLPAVDNPTLLKLFANDPDLPDVPTLQATASFVERLRRFSDEVDRVLAEGRESPESGARALEGFLDDAGFEHEHDLRLFFDLLLDADPATARNTMSAVGKDTVRKLMPVVPGQLRAMLGPERLLEKLDVTVDATEAELRRGIGLLIGETSGNFRIEEPFLERLYEIVADRAYISPGGTARLVSETSFSLEGMILNQPEAAVAMLSADSALSIALVKGSDPLTAPPARIVYRLIAADPGLAATIIITLDQDGHRETAVEALAYLAYDKARSEKYPQLPISLTQDGDFLKSLLERQGAAWLSARLANPWTCTASGRPRGRLRRTSWSITARRWKQRRAAWTRKPEGA